MESIFSLLFIIKIAFTCLQISIFTGINLLLITICCKKGSTEEYQTMNLKPRKNTALKTPAQRRAIAKIRQGRVTPANQSETIDDAESNWGAVQKVEGDV